MPGEAHSLMLKSDWFGREALAVPVLLVSLPSSGSRYVEWVFKLWYDSELCAGLCDNSIMMSNASAERCLSGILMRQSQIVHSLLQALTR